MTQKEEIAKLKKQIIELKENVASLVDDRAEAIKDRDLYRDYCVFNFKWFLGFLSENKTPSLTYLIAEHTKLFNKTERFYMELAE